MRSASVSTSSRDVGRYEDGLVLEGQLSHEVVELDALAGVGAVQRLIEDEHIGLMHHGGGESHALPHSPGVAAELSALRLGHSGALDGEIGGLGYVGHAMQLCGELDELPPGIEPVDGLVLGHDADATVEVGIAARGLAEDGDGAVRRGGQSLDHLEEGGLARAVWSQKARDAGPNLERNVVHGNHAAVPLPIRFPTEMTGGDASVISSFSGIGVAAARPGRGTRSAYQAMGMESCSSLRTSAMSSSLSLPKMMSLMCVGARPTSSKVNHLAKSPVTRSH